MQTDEAGMAKTLLTKDPLLLGQIMLARAKVVLLPVPKRAVRKKMGG